MAIVAIVGMAGSGKSEAAQSFLNAGFERIYFGGLVVEEVKNRGLKVCEANERKVRIEFRKKRGMAAMALLSIPKIEALEKQGKHVLIDGLYSWSELIVLREKFPSLKVVAIFASPQIRHARLASRAVRALKPEDAVARDRAEIEEMEKAGPIAYADFTIINEGSKAELKKQAGLILIKIK